MTAIPDDALLQHASRAKGKVVLITGGANGIGRATARVFAQHGAKLVIGDLDEKVCRETEAELRSLGSEAIARRCDVTSWEDQCDLFTAALSKFGAVDVVIPNAGVNEIGTFTELQFKDGRPLPPNLKTLDINLTGVLYTTHLGMHYLKQNPKSGAMRAIVLLGSMASWQPMQGGTMYGATKHGVLGAMRALHPDCRQLGIRIGIVHPWFSPTGIITPEYKTLLDGIPMVPLERVAATIVHVATHPDMKTSGYVWMLPDDQPLLRLEREQLREGVYKLIDERLKERLRASRATTGTKAKM